MELVALGLLMFGLALAEPVSRRLATARWPGRDPVGALLLWQALRRQLSLEGNETPTLAALGMAERELVWTTTLGAVWIGIAGAVVAAITAVALSPLVPIGVARRMEVECSSND